MRLSTVWDIALAVAIAGLALAVLDIFLSDAQKRWLSDRTLQAWHWLAEAKRTSLLDWLKRYRRPITWTGVLLVSVYVTWAFEKALAPPAQVIPVALCIFAVGVYFGFKIVGITLRARSLFRAVVRATIIVGVTLAPAAIFFGSVAFFQSEFLGLAKEYAAGVTARTLTLGPALFALFFVWTLILCVNLTVIAVIFWSVLALPLIVIYLLSVLLFCLEFIVRRVAEYPKGPIFAGSLLLGAISGIFRVILAGH
jgi:hypothetical protein